jgi:hypothetical protein
MRDTDSEVVANFDLVDPSKNPRSMSYSLKDCNECGGTALGGSHKCSNGHDILTAAKGEDATVQVFAPKSRLNKVFNLVRALTELADGHHNDGARAPFATLVLKKSAF